MDHFQIHFFFGLLLDEELKKALSQSDERNSNFLINEDERYLTKTDYKGKSYIGKKIAPIESLDELEQLEQNIYSLLKKVLPDYSFQKNSLELIPLKSTVT